MEKKFLDFIQQNSPDGGFLQSEHWRKFQESYGRKAHNVLAGGENGELVAYANIITHTLPIVGDYFYIPRGPIIQVQSSKFKVQSFCKNLASLARENNIGWIRVEPNSEKELDLLEKNLPKDVRIKKSSADVQPREILLLDITKSEKELLAQMKQKTRYNIRLAEKRGVHVTCNVKHLPDLLHNSKQAGVTQESLEEFLKLIKITAERDKITPHSDDYYRKMFEVIPGNVLKLYVAEYEGKAISANIVSFFGKTATYMHGASDNIHREVMAPYLLQWRQIQDAKKLGCTRYDLGGVKTEKIPDTRYQIPDTWSGITRFKTGFAPDVEPVRFPGCYDIILNQSKYWLYRILRKLKS